ncbi:hypothetical protein LRD18_01895 [Halorhodospira halochloris]|uniref:contractile injection system protein, VgrG/Pvc8 family n=1 Tax=Halorhodospira halochloris TaxID=1052 RepID=UPI001EE8BCA3|nr:contractile injection system protein, VgrG/Pvc8 family [Halorhodospira halochloris]MCG5529626.1 hypothetical protein [Halorhodospira halochloris]
MSDNLEQSKIWARVEVAGIVLQITAIDGEEKLSAPFRFDFSGPLDGECSRLWQSNLIVGNVAKLSWANSGWAPREVSGVVTSWSSGDCPVSGERRFTGRIEPCINQLNWNHSTRLYSRIEKRELVAQLLAKVGYDEDDFDWRVGSSTGQRGFILQAAESDYALLQRILAREGIYYTWIDGPTERPIFVDDSSALPGLQLRPNSCDNQLKVAPGNTLGHQHGYGLSGYRIREKLVEQPFVSAAKAHRYTDAGFDIERLQRIYSERSTGQQYRFFAWGYCSALRAGVCVNVSDLAAGGDDFVSRYEGRHLIVSARHRLRRGSSGQEFWVEIESMPELLGSKLLRYRPELPATQVRPLVMSAQVANSGHGAGRAQTAAAGMARVEAVVAEEGFAPISDPVQRLQPFASPAVHGAGWYTPLSGGNRVLVSCFDHDPDLPVILGVLPQAREKPLAPPFKCHDGGVQTRTGQGLLVEGAGSCAADGSRISLHSPGLASLLDIKLGQSRSADMVRLACAEGPIELDCQAQAQEIAAGQRSEAVAANDRLEVANGCASFDSAANISVRAGGSAVVGSSESLNCSAAGNVEFNAKAGMAITAGHDLELGSAGKGVEVQVDQGRFSLQAQESLDVSSLNGMVSFANGANSAGVAVSAQGSVRIWGNSITIAADQNISLTGDVEYSS